MGARLLVSIHIPSHLSSLLTYFQPPVPESQGGVLQRHLGRDQLEGSGEAFPVNTKLWEGLSWLSAALKSSN